MQKTFMKSSMTMRKLKTGQSEPGATLAQRDDNSPIAVIEVLDNAAYSEMLRDTERSSKCVLLWLFVLIVVAFSSCLIHSFLTNDFTSLSSSLMCWAVFV